ncbi:DUF4389 domain-containing protein [Kitasatospora sp. NPDC002227]|uniref:DUF4389 domain-containing protein n=1 Tax=Kitasatospora sp. NPDC002227 TaxID=3154773 RepID=UPI003317BE1D
MAATGWSAPPQAGFEQEWLPELDLPGAKSQRRLTVLLRWLLLIPHFIALFVLGIVAFVLTVVGWFGALVLGRLPEPCAGFLSGYVAYATRVQASAMLLVDEYPPFALQAPPEYPVQVWLRPGELNRLAVFFRIILMIPAAVINSLLVGGWYVLAFITWLITLVMGRLPQPLWEATAATLRYTMRYNAYAMMVTSAYPKRLFGDSEPYGQQEARSASRPLRLGTGGKVLVVLFLLLGLAGNSSSAVFRSDSSSGSSSVQVY